MPTDRDPHRNPSPRGPWMTTDDLNDLRASTLTHAHQLVMATHRDPMSRYSNVLAHPLAPEPVDHLSEQDRRSRRLADLQGGRRRARRPAMGAVLGDRCVIRAALDRVHAKSGHGHLRGRLLGAALLVALRRPAVDGAIDLSDSRRAAASGRGHVLRPAVTGASPGDCSDTDGCVLSTWMVFAYVPPVHAPAASHPSITSGIGPCP